MKDEPLQKGTPAEYEMILARFTEEVIDPWIKKKAQEAAEEWTNIDLRRWKHKERGNQRKP